MQFRGIRIVLCLFVCASLALAQVSTSRLTGTVQDASGALVPGATITATHEATGNVLTTTTSDSGSYVFEAIQTGSYAIGVAASGFKKYNTRGNIVTIGQPTTVNITLEVGAVTEQVE